MLNYENQLNLGNIYSKCSEMFKEQRPQFLQLLDKYIDINAYIPFSFKAENNPKQINSTINKLKAFYKFNGIDKSTDDIYKQAFKSLPKTASSDSSIRKMYSNRSFLLW